MRRDFVGSLEKMEIQVEYDKKHIKFFITKKIFICPLLQTIIAQDSILQQLFVIRRM